MYLIVNKILQIGIADYGTNTEKFAYMDEHNILKIYLTLRQAKIFDSEAILDGGFSCSNKRKQ